MKKLRCVCQYKVLGFSLDEVKKVTQSQNPYKLLSETIHSQQAKIDEEIQDLEQKKERLSAVYEQIKETGKVKVESIEDMDDLLVKRNRHRKTEVMTYVFLGCYIILLSISFP